jgi:hypothetical protein
LSCSPLSVCCRAVAFPSETIVEEADDIAEVWFMIAFCHRKLGDTQTDAAVEALYRAKEVIELYKLEQVDPELAALSAEIEKMLGELTTARSASPSS